jgi:multisubunit Na+/H+ antiporter MnhF subunit
MDSQATSLVCESNPPSHNKNTNRLIPGVPITPGLRKGLNNFLARRWIWMPLLAFLITRLGIAFVAYFSTPILVDSSVPPYHLRPDNTLIDVFASRWDTGFYTSIADHGYRIQGEQFPSVAFFPLLPVLIRVIRLLTGDTLFSGLLVANAALLAAVMLLHLLAADEHDQHTADRAVWYLLIFPASFFGSAIYSESLFLLLSIASLYLARKNRWWVAGVASILGAMTRFIGILLAPLLVVEWWQQRKQYWEAPDTIDEQNMAVKRKPPDWTDLVAASLAPIGTLAYMIHLAREFGDALAFLHASNAWGRTPANFLATLAELMARPPQGWLSALSAGALPLDNWLDLSFVIFFVTLGIVLLVQKRYSEGIFVLLGALLPFSSGLLMSQRRYMWVLFPAFILLARWGRNPWVDRIIFVISLLLLGLFTAMFANWYWVG